MAQSKAIGIARGDAIGVLAIVTPTLGAITVPSPSILNTVAAGAVAFATVGRTAGSTLTLTGPAFTSGFLNINSATGNVVGGTNAPLTAGSQTGTYSIVEMLAGAIGSPRTSGPFASITVSAAPALNALGVTWGTITDQLAPGAQVGTITGATTGSSITMTGAAFSSGALAVNSTGRTIVIGVAGPLPFVANTGIGALVETLAGYTTTTTAFASQTVTTTRPIATSAPSIAGGTAVGATMTATPGAYTGSPTSFTRQFLSGTTVVATNVLTYVTQVGDAGVSITFTEIAINAGGQSAPNGSPAVSNAIGPIVASSAPAATAAPVIASSGPNVPGAVFTATPGTYNGAPTSYTRQWLRGGVAIAGATGLTYTLVNADYSTVTTFSEIATNGIGSAAANVSNALKVATLYDSFTAADGTALTAHTTDSGATWTSDQAGSLVISGNKAFANSYPLPFMTGSATLAADCFVQADIGITTTTGTNYIVALRASGAGYAGTYYALQVVIASNSEQYYIVKSVAGAQSNLYTGAPAYGAPAASRNARLEIVGNTLTLKVNGVVIGAPITDSASPITAAGKIGMRYSSNDGTAAGLNLDNLIAGAL